MTNYPIGDFLIQVKNAAMAGRREVKTRSSNMIKAVADVMKKEKILDEVSVKDGFIEVKLAYRKKKPVLMNLKLVSKPGLRVYNDVDTLENFKGPSTLLVSTSKGILSREDAIKKRVGGEVIVEIW